MRWGVCRMNPSFRWSPTPQAERREARSVEWVGCGKRGERMQALIDFECEFGSRGGNCTS
ncbi:hypothetical protein MUK42_16100 [Musa troglodytarum]|uniref:Uncharacterized protein n=1 Tax=Musa troglodytarum TaxID=320322 RepID=A0A9E7HIV3_9LILI|nr:hypothetical protein MUK42_16100 [Musa troglodytarum]